MMIGVAISYPVNVVLIATASSTRDAPPMLAAVAARR